MADDSVLSEILKGFNTMQMNLGLMPTAGMQGGGGFGPMSTPMLAPLPVKHPGEFSQEISYQTSAMIQRNIAPHLPPMPPSASAYSQQFRARMDSIQSQYSTPYQAEMYASQAGQQGFNGLPSPIFQTPANMGVYRPGHEAPRAFSTTRPLPLIQTPFSPVLPPPMFQTPMQQGYQQQMQREEAMFARAGAAAPAAAYGGAALATTAMGGFMGRSLLSGLGAPGRIAGGLLGVAGGAMLGFGPIGMGAEYGMQQGIVNPLMETRAYGNQLESMSRKFVIGGSDLNRMGGGLSSQASMGLANALKDMIAEGESSGFNMRDMMGIGNMAASSGMMDMAQNKEQITAQFKNIAKGLRTFMALAQEPDVQQAMQQMSTLRTLGLSIPETNVAAQNAVKFARMAGTSVGDLAATAGAPGAMTFQQLGMTGGLGYQVGMGAAAYARGAVGAGSYTPAQLALAGGVRGLQQTLTETAGAGLGIDFPIMAMLGRGDDGKLRIDESRVKDVMSGKYSLSEQAAMGSSNMARLGGGRAILELQTRMGEMQNELGMALGPEGSILLALRQATNIQKAMGGALPLGSALQMLGMSASSANATAQMAHNPEWWADLRRQAEVDIREIRDRTAVERERAAGASGLVASVGRGVHTALAPVRGVGERVSAAHESISEWWTDRGEEADARRTDARYIRAPRQFDVSNRKHQATINAFVQSKDYDRFISRNQASWDRSSDAERAEVDRYGSTKGQFAKAGWNVGVGALGLIFKPLMLAGIGAEIAGVYPSFDAPQDSQVVRSAKILGGYRSIVADWAPSLMTFTRGMAAMLGDTSAQEMNQQAMSAARAGEMLQAGERMESATAGRVYKDIQRSAAAIRTAAGEGAPKGDMMQGMTRSIIALWKKKSHWIGGDEASTEAEIKEAAIQGLIASGDSRATATQVVNANPKILEVAQRQAANEAPDAAQGGYAALKQAPGVARGGAAADEFERTIKSVEKTEKETMTAMGMGSDILSGNVRTGFWRKYADDTERTAFKDMLMENDSDTMLVMAAQALDADGKTEAADSILAGLAERKVDVDAIRRKLGKKVSRMSEDQKNALIRSGTKIQGKTGKEQADLISGAIGAIKTNRGAVQVAAGVARMAETFKAFKDVTSTSDDAMMDIMSKLSKDEEQLGRTSPAMRTLIKKFNAAGSEEERKGIAREFRGLVHKRGDKSMTVGGKGVGSKAEGAVRSRLEIEEDIAASIKGGDSQGAFAKAVPLFAKASSDLQAASEQLKDAAKITKLRAGLW